MAILLGIPYHVGLIYSAGNSWFISSAETSTLITLVTGFLASFRMPLFFMVAGLLTALVLSRRDPGQWLRSRIVRLGVPLITATLLVSPIVMIFLAENALINGEATGFWAAYAYYLTSLGNHWIGHLWFLYVLIELSFITFLLAPHLPKLSAFAQAHLFVPGGGVKTRSLFLFAAAVVIYEIGIETLFFLLDRQFGSLSAFIAATKIEPFFEMLPYYVAGLALFGQRDLEIHKSLQVFAVALVSGLVYAIVWNEPGLVNKLLRYATGASMAVLFSAIVISYAQKSWVIFNRRIQFVVDASFTIYLIHYPICVFIGFVLTYYEFNVYVGYLFNIAATGGLSLAFHMMIAQSATALFLFNGASGSKNANTQQRA